MVSLSNDLHKFWHTAYGINFSILGIILLANTTQKKYYTFIISIYVGKFFMLGLYATKEGTFSFDSVEKSNKSMGLVFEENYAKF